MLVCKCLVHIFWFQLCSLPEEKSCFPLQVDTINPYRGCMHHNTEVKTNFLSNDCGYQYQSMHNYCQLTPDDITITNFLCLCKEIQKCSILAVSCQPASMPTCKNSRIMEEFFVKFGIGNFY